MVAGQIIRLVSDNGSGRIVQNRRHHRPVVLIAGRDLRGGDEARALTDAETARLAEIAAELGTHKNRLNEIRIEVEVLYESAVRNVKTGSPAEISSLLREILQIL